MSRKNSFLNKGPRVAGIVKILSVLEHQNKYFTELYNDSSIVFKRSLLRYNKFLVDHGLVKKDKKWGFDTKGKSQCLVYYSITDKGRTLLGLLR